MDLSVWLKSLEDTGLATGIRNSLYLFPFLEAAHVMALSVVFGTVTIVDLRVLGIASTRRAFSRMSPELLRMAWGAFALAALTGSLMFMTNARVYAHNTAFLVKLSLLALAGLNMAFFHLTAGRMVARWDKSPSAPPIGKVAATLSLTIWIGVVFAGRVIGFTTTGAQAKQQEAPPATNFDDFLTGGPGSDATGPDAGSSSSAPAAAAAPASSDGAVANSSIRSIMTGMLDPSGKFLFASLPGASQGASEKAPGPGQDWELLQHHLQVLVDARPLLIEPGLKVAEPGSRSANPAAQREPAEVQRLLDAQHADFVQRVDSLRDAAVQGLTAVKAHDTKALSTAITAIDKACESCHLHYWTLSGKGAGQTAHEQTAHETGGNIE